jgi:hypothetical protein
MRHLLSTGALALGVLVASFTASITRSALADEKELPTPEIMVNEGIAFSWKEDDKVKPVAYDVVSAWKDTDPKHADCQKYSTQLKGATWCFASEANLKSFIAKTDKDGDNTYIPFAGGRCALGASWGRLRAKGDPRTARIVQGDQGPILVLQSAEKWWPMFKHEMFTRIQVAQMRLDFAKRVGDVVPNDKLK